MQENYEKHGMILVALDESPYSFSTAKLAIQFAKMTNRMVYGLYVVETGVISNENSKLPVELPGDQKPLSPSAALINLEGLGNQTLSKLKSDCQKAGVAVITEIVIGGIPETIQQKADQSVLVSIGRYGQDHPVGSEFLGDNLRPICHMVYKPILVGGEVEPLVIRRILLAVPNESSIQRSIEAVSHFGGSLLDERAKRLGQYPLIKSERNVRSDSPNSVFSVDTFVKLISKSALEIASEAIHQEVDLLILGGYPHITPLGWLEGTLPEQVIRKVKTPVILI